jgi:dTMP kinase
MTDLRASPGGHGLKGTLVVLEGIDGSGRSTHVRLLEDALRYSGRAVTRTSLGTSAIAGDPIRRAKRDRRAGPVETTLLYAADIAERIEQQILPALGAGLVVLADRYVYTPMARAEARGLERHWLDETFGFAVAPDAVLFLDVDPATAIARRADATAHAHEPGHDLRLSAGATEGYRQFQDRLYACFNAYAETYNFQRVPGSGSIRQVQARLQRTALAVVDKRKGT